MKVTPPTNAAHHANIDRPAPRRNVNVAHHANAKHAADAGEPVGVVERDFASVLDELARGGDAAHRDDTGDSREQSADLAARAREAGRRDDERDDERDDDAGRGGGNAESARARGEARAETRPAAPAARAILHIADLERIAAAARAQITAARGEVTLRLHRSVLEGLEIKLKLDAGGRVHAELIAATERLRSQIDRRAPDLAELMRSRGVPLASLKTSIDTRSSGDDAERDAPHRDAPVVNAIDAGSATDAGTTSEIPDSGAEVSSGIVYRA